MSVETRTRDGAGVIRTALLTVVTGGLAFLVATAFGQSPAIGVVFAVLIGGIALLIRFLGARWRGEGRGDGRQGAEARVSENSHV